MSPIPSDISKIAGPFLLGYLLNYGLYGVLTVQMYIYYNAFPNDRTTVKAIVYGVYIVETMQTIMVTWDAFHNFSSGFGDPETFDSKTGLLWFDVCLFDGLVGFVVQTFFAYRIYLLSKSKLMTAVIVFMALLQLGGAIAGSSLRKIAGSLFSSGQSITIAAAFWLVGSAACDIVIAISMTYVLSKHDAGFQDTRNLVNRIIRLTMETGSLSAALATVILILFLVVPKTPYHITAVLVLAKVYSNSLMVIFNSRVKIVGGRGESTSGGEEVNTSKNFGRPVMEPAHAHPIQFNEYKLKKALREPTQKDDDSMATTSQF